MFLSGDRTHTQTARDIEGHRQRQTQTGRDKLTEAQTETGTETDRHTDRHRCIGVLRWNRWTATMSCVLQSEMTTKLTCCRAAVLNLFRIADHLTNFISVRGPPKNVYIFLGKFLNFWQPFLVIFLTFLSRFADHQKEFRKCSQFPCIFQGEGQKKTFQFPFAI